MAPRGNGRNKCADLLSDVPQPSRAIRVGSVSLTLWGDSARPALDADRRRASPNRSFVDFVAAVHSAMAASKEDRSLVKKFVAGSNGSTAPVRDYRMQSFDSECVAIVGWHSRTTAAAITDALGGAGEGQVSR